MKPAKRYVFLEKLAELKAANEVGPNSSPIKRQFFGGGYGGGYGGGFGGLTSGLQELGREAVTFVLWSFTI